MTRLEDLLATADRQFAARSYDAAIDTCRTALAEAPDDAARAALESRLAAAIKARDSVRGPEVLLREARAHYHAGRRDEAAELALRVLAIDPDNSEAAQLCDRFTTPEELPAMPAAPPPEKPRSVEPRRPAREAHAESFRTITPPSFKLVEDDPSMLERSRHEDYVPEPPISILDPTPRPDPQKNRMAAVGAVFAIAFFVAVVAGVQSKRHTNRYNPRPTAVEETASVPVLISKVDPAYPDSARADGIEGTVELAIEIEPDGTVNPQAVVHGINQELDGLAIIAVRQWRYQPAMRAGQPVRVSANVEVKFPPI